MNSEDLSPGNPWNRRVAPRYRSVFPVGLEFGFASICECKALNISTSGIRVVLSQAPAIQEEFQLTLCLDEDNLVELKGKAVWKEELGSFGTHVMGLTFAPGQYVPRGKIQDWLNKQGCAA